MTTCNIQSEYQIAAIIKLVHKMALSDEEVSDICMV